MATLHPVVLRSRLNTQGKYPIYIALTHKRKVSHLPTNYDIDELYQFEKGEIVCRKDSKEKNQRLQYTLSEYQEKLDSIQDQYIYTCKQLKEILEGKKRLESQVTVKEYFELRISRFIIESRSNYAKMNRETLNSFLKIIGDITLQSISTNTIELYHDSIKKYSNATQQIRLMHIKACINEAIKKGYVKYDIHPFATTRTPSPGIRMLDITVEDFQKIRDFKTKHKRLKLARDLFLISFYTGGMNLADIVKVDFSQDIVKYVRTKTANKKQNNKEIVFTIPEEVKPIFNKYLKRNGKLGFNLKLPYRNFQIYVNQCLKLLADQLDISGNFCFYSARKTFSQFAFDLGIKTELIEYCIGQSMKSNRPIYNYIRVMQRQADMAIRRVIDYTNSPDEFEIDIFAH